MDWVSHFDLFLFDFDGLLVNTEKLHYQAYIEMLKKYNCTLNWSFASFCKEAHLNATALKNALYQAFPELPKDWNRLYQEKKEIYFDLLQAGQVELMDGVEKLLFELQKRGAKRCVVTNSFFEQTELIRSKNQALQTLDHWITRESYESPKPNPDGYLQAISLYAKTGDRIIGFEDSKRGIEALKQTTALAVLICPSYHPLVESARKSADLYFDSFLDIEESAFCN